jgi:outer membrane phospholipase A
MKLRPGMRACLLLSVLACASPARAERLLIPDTRTLAPGGPMEATLFVTNDSAQAATLDLPKRLTLRTRGVAAAPDIVLSLEASQLSPVTIQPGGFVRARYTGQLPEGLVGNLVLEPVDFDGPALGLTSAYPAKETQPAQVKLAPPEVKTEAVLSAVGPSDRDTARFLTAFSPYEPNYFSVGSNGPTNAKFQVSLKFRVFNPETKTPFLEGLYLAYSQTSIWQTGLSSAPFYDSSYRPSVFYLNEDVSRWPLRKTSRLGFQAGLEHESNGKDGIASRSMNLAFVRPTLTFPFAGGYFVAVSPKIYAYLEKADNPDIPYYRGYSDMLFKVGSIDGTQLATTVRKGTGKDPYSVELDLSIPLKTAKLGNLGGYLHLQYFNGYGESLLDYNRRVLPQFRIGLMITR